MNCKALLTADQASPRLPKKLETPVRTRAGTFSRYSVAVGLRTTASTLSFRRVTWRLYGSKGSRGFAFVEMSNADAATAAIAALANHSMDNRTLTINVARERTEGGSRGGYGDRSGGRSNSYGNR